MQSICWTQGSREAPCVHFSSQLKEIKYSRIQAYPTSFQTPSPQSCRAHRKDWPVSSRSKGTGTLKWAPTPGFHFWPYRRHLAACLEVTNLWVSHGWEWSALWFPTVVGMKRSFCFFSSSFWNCRHRHLSFVIWPRAWRLGRGDYGFDFENSNLFLEAIGGGMLKAVKQQADFREPLNSLSIEGGHWFIGKW